MISKHTAYAEVVVPGHWEDHGAYEDASAWVDLAVPVPVWSWGHEVDEPSILSTWSVLGGGLIPSSINRTSYTARSGARSWAPGWYGANPGVERVGSMTHTFDGLTPGCTYRLSVWGNRPTGWAFGEAVSLDYPTTQTDLDTSWQETTREYVAESSSLTVTLWIIDEYTGADDFGQIRLDDFSLVATTEWVAAQEWVPDLVWVTQNVALDVTDASITLDEGWAPYVQGELVCAMPDSATLEAIDPRAGARVRLRLHQRFGESEPLSALSTAWAGLDLADVTTAIAGTFLHALSATYGQAYNRVGMRPSTHRLLDLCLRSRQTDHDTGTMHLSVASDEALAQDWALVSTVTVSPGTTSVRDICSWALGQLGAYLTAGDADATIATDATSWTPGVSAWNYLYPLVNAAGLRLWCDEARNWHLTSPEDGTTGALMLSAEQNLTAAVQTIDRDSRWADAVVVKYRWTDTLGATQTAYDTAFVDGWSKVRAFEYDRPWPGPGAATALLARERGRGRELDLSAVNDYRATPGQTLVATVPGTPIQTGVVTAVTWTLPADLMRIGSRDLVDNPPDAWLDTPPGTAWTEVPAGIDWTEYEYLFEGTV